MNNEISLIFLIYWTLDKRILLSDSFEQPKWHNFKLIATAKIRVYLQPMQYNKN
ncbi:hypothetical protein [Candidatus Tisiphia endosymbiont of Ditula angustiorana]|uniref:hypothetical protein n=1 Tax=Candidatus Tisiphia endosymbiont of Ditula angustiorana TaxID=3066272 RepID=UPI00312C890F